MHRSSPRPLLAVVLVTLLGVLGSMALQSPAASAVPPGAPSPCTAVQTADGIAVTWTRPTSGTPVWRYVLRIKGQVTPTIQLDAADRQTENGQRSYLWTGTTAGGSSPLTMMVRAKNGESKPGDWCRATVTTETDREPSPTPEPTPTPEPSPTGEPPSTVSSRASSTASSGDLAIRVFPHYLNKTYGSHRAVLDTLGRLGVTRVSGLLTPNMAPSVTRFYQDAYARHGIKVWFAVGQPGDVLTDAQWADVRAQLSGPLAGMVELVSGWNEPNHRVGGSWEVPTAAHQNRLWAETQQVNAAGQDIKVGTPPLWSGNVNEQYADLRLLAPKIAGSYDWINWHLYPHGNTGSDLAALIDRQVAEFTAAYGQVPMVNSETGYFTAQNYTGGSNPSTESEQATQLSDLVALHRARGIGLSYFELLDDPDPTGANREAHFGLVRTPSLDSTTWSDKPAFAVFRDLVTQ
jgi:hypothetical protein